MGLRGSVAARERPVLAGITSGLHILGEGVAELLWPTRCVLCDVPGTLLCDECRLELPYIDPLHACPYCGQPYGKFACVNCNSFIVKHRGLAPEQRVSARGESGDSQGVSNEVIGDDPRASEEDNDQQVLDRIVSVFEFVDPCRKLITSYKDRKEVRLATVLADLLCAYVDPRWVVQGCTAIVAIPAREQAICERGFDHMKKVGEELACLTGLPLLDALATGERGDQRGLSAFGRQTNMRDSFVPKPMLADVAHELPEHIILIDDVFTTGATLTSAATTLKAMGAEKVFGLTVARLP